MSSNRVTIIARGKVKITLPTGEERICNTVIRGTGTEVYEKYEPEFGYDHYLDDIEEDSFMLEDYCEDVETDEDYAQTYPLTQLDTMFTLVDEPCDYDWDIVDTAD